MTEAWKREREMKGLGREDGEGGLERRRKKKRRMGRMVLDAMAYEWMRAKTNTREICKLSYSNVRGPH